MRRLVVKTTVVAALVGLGWLAGRAQSSGPDFEIKIDAPGGETTVSCLRGCQLAWVERMDPATVKPTKTFFTYSCSGHRCASGRVGGWVTK